MWLVPSGDSLSMGWGELGGTSGGCGWMISGQKTVFCWVSVP
jgi:hypothetical protein